MARVHEGWISKLEQRTVEVMIPKFTITRGLRLASALKSMGMAAPFTPDLADFSAISRLPLFIFEVLHKAFVEVDELGTEAAAATAVAMGWGDIVGVYGKPIPVFRADHPFLFLIRHRCSGSILFLGRFVNPRG